jgi:hypothetical protein
MNARIPRRRQGDARRLWNQGAQGAGAVPEEHAAGAPAWKPQLVDLAALALCLFQVAYVVVQAVRVPLGSFDSWSLWEYKGRLFWLDGGISGGFLHDHAAIFAHPAYPPLVPLLIAWVYGWLGAADPTLMKPLFACFFAALLLAFFAALRSRVGPRGALLATTALALLPQVADYAGTGLADVPMTAALVAGAAVLARWWEDGDDGALAAAGAVLGIALLIKHDALVFAVPAFLCVAARARGWRALLSLALPVCLIGVPWYAYVRFAAVPDRDFLPLTAANVVAHAGRVGGIARLFALNLLAAGEWSVLWYAFGALLIVGLVRRRLRAPALLLPVLLPLALYVCSLSLSAWPDYLLHARTSLDRLILVTAPFALWFVAEQLRQARPRAFQRADLDRRTRLPESCAPIPAPFAARPARPLPSPCAARPAPRHRRPASGDGESGLHDACADDHQPAGAGDGSGHRPGVSQMPSGVRLPGPDHPL